MQYIVDRVSCINMALITLTMRVTEVVIDPILIPWTRIVNSTVRSQYVMCWPTTL